MKRESAALKFWCQRFESITSTRTQMGHELHFCKRTDEWSLILTERCRSFRGSLGKVFEQAVEWIEQQTKGEA